MNENKPNTNPQYSDMLAGYNKVSTEVSPNGAWCLNIWFTRNYDIPGYIGLVPSFAAEFIRIQGNTLNNNHYILKLGCLDGLVPEVNWNLPNKVCGIYLEHDCYALFRYGPRKRARREYVHHAPHEPPFTAREIQRITSNSN